MLTRLTYARLSGSQTIVVATAALLALCVIYFAWIRQADLRPVAQLVPAEQIPLCIDRYIGQRDDKLPKLDGLWEVFWLCYKTTERQLLYEEQVIRNENFVFQRFENTIIMFMVVSITISGVILAGLQLLASYKLASLGKGSLSEGGEVNLSSTAIAVKSSVVGVIILGISFAFFLVFVLYVYTFTQVADRTPPVAQASAPSSAPAQSQQGGARTDGDTANVGQAHPAQPPSHDAPSSKP
jgi:hypothetical protein